MLALFKLTWAFLILNSLVGHLVSFNTMFNLEQQCSCGSHSVSSHSVHQTLDEMDFERGLPSRLSTKLFTRQFKWLFPKLTPSLTWVTSFLISFNTWSAGIWSAAVDGDLDRVKSFIDKGTDPNLRDSSGYTALVSVFGELIGGFIGLHYNCHLFLFVASFIALQQPEWSSGCLQDSSGEWRLCITSDARRGHATAQSSVLRPSRCGQTHSASWSRPRTLWQWWCFCLA